MVVLDFVNPGAQQTNVSQGRLPDGGAAIVSFARTASPERSNWPPRRWWSMRSSRIRRPVRRRHRVVQCSGAEVDVSGWWLSDDRSSKKFQICPGRSPAGGFLVLYENQLARAFAQFAGDEVVLSAESGGAPTGYRSQVSFGAAETAWRLPRGAARRVEDEFWPLTAHV
jgi:hypothetical protein